jgi:UDP-N-acetylglucosamine diphosphorylase / glucose-1-phosphate thymidylyltransferase / UDP-N-acetylgalactosamine diphosphorylase / glucosamine-1-phosphate N-acetyltransferase / galactosamine-1-phosphate N-acetyltransferase
LKAALQRFFLCPFTQENSVFLAVQRPLPIHPNPMNPHTIILAEPRNRDALYPFSILHPAFELRCGALRLFEKVQRCFPASHLVFHGRAPVCASFHARFGTVSLESLEHLPKSASVLVLQGNVLCTQQLRAVLAEYCTKIFAQTLTDDRKHQPIVFTSNGEPFAAFFEKKALLDTPSIEAICALQGVFFANAIPIEIPEALIITHLWDTIKHSATGIQEDAHFFTMNGDEKTSGLQGVYALNPANISIGENVAIAPLVVIDARKGAVVIGSHVDIQPHVSIVGPCYIGDNTLIKAGTRLYEGTSLGEHSKVAGELKNTIFQGFGNKQHEGCLGYSFISEWVNLGAGTNVSDLKNNYGTIRVRFSPDKAREINTGTRSLGLLAGDHTKSGINTSFNTGSVTGVGANIFEGKPDKYVRSYSWGGLADSPFFEEEKAIELARTVMSRRKRILTPEEEHLLREEFRSRNS